MKKLIILLLLSAVILLIDTPNAAAEENDGTLSEVLLRTLPTVTARYELVTTVLDRVMEMARKQKPEDKSFKGIIVAAPRAKDFRISCDLRDVPVGFVLQTIAKILFAELVVVDGCVMFVANEAYTASSVPRHMDLSPQALKALGLKRAPSAVELQEALEKCGIFFDGDSKVGISTNGQFAVVRLRYSESELLESLIELFNRGFKVSP